MNPIDGGTTKGPYQVVLSVIFGKLTIKTDHNDFSLLF